MSGRPSRLQPSAGLSKSSALSHAYIQYPPLRCRIPGLRGLFFDDGNKLLICRTGDQIFSWKTVPFNPAVAYTTDAITEGPILSIRYSLDLKIIAIQRSNHEIQFLIRETGETFSQKCRPEPESILGFFWTDCPLCNIVFVKTSGLDLFAYSSDSKSIHLVESKKLNVSWYAYTHESRLVLMASGMQCKTFHGFQLSAAGIVRLPKFEMAMAKSDANSKPVLAIEDIFIITVYGRIYCLQVDRIAMLLHTYRFYRDAVVQQGSLPIYSSWISVGVVDNVLLVHQVDAKVVILYDIFTDSRAPISAPLPLLLRGFPGPNIDVRSSKQGSASLEADAVPDEAIVYGDGWKFLVPDLICDHVNKLVWKIHIDLEAIASSSSEVPSLLEFLQRRKLEVSKAKQLCLTLTRTTILEHRPVATVAKAIDVLVSSYTRSSKVGPNVKESKTDRTQSVMPQVGGSGPVPGTNNRDSTTEVESEALHRTSIFPSSDSEENADIEQLNTVPGNHQSIVDRERWRGIISSTEVQASSSQYQHLGPGCNRLNDDVSDEESLISSPSISPDEMYSFVFAPVEEEIVGDPSYLLAIIIEFLRRVNSEKIKVNPNIYVLTVQILARNERYTEIGLFVQQKIIEPSKEVALQLLESGRHNFPTRKLGLDMLRQLYLHYDYVSLLVQDGYYLEALRYTRKFKILEWSQHKARVCLYVVPCYSLTQTGVMSHPLSRCVLEDHQAWVLVSHLLNIRIYDVPQELS
ncbi:regulator of MON1-CCZ1 complex isoform X2 [Benincasa hispida]|uniref:regulator of MON1-CCZ1 complex isoform X2 n=1 Tax=Benincasa hispida TaxID=102211 RepID=UPI0019006D6F|nr:regulator of MON1-CCZ1 complex isoform X2 [Benincasa hispida]